MARPLALVSTRVGPRPLTRSFPIPLKLATPFGESAVQPRTEFVAVRAHRHNFEEG